MRLPVPETLPHVHMFNSEFGGATHVNKSSSTKMIKTVVYDSAARPDSSLATGTLNGEQET